MAHKGRKHIGSLKVECPLTPVLHYLPKFAQVHVHWMSDAIQPFHSPSPSLPSALNLSQHEDLFQWVSSSHQVQSTGVSASASVLPIRIHSGLISFRTDWFYWISTLISQRWENIFISQWDTAVPTRQAQSINVNHADDRGVHPGTCVCQTPFFPFQPPHKALHSTVVHSGRHILIQAGGLLNTGMRSWVFLTPSGLTPVTKFL